MEIKARRHTHPNELGRADRNPLVSQKVCMTQLRACEASDQRCRVLGPKGDKMVDS